MIPLQIISEHRQKTDVPVLDFPGLGKDLMQGALDRSVFPVELSNQLEDFVNGLLGQDVINKVANEQFKGGTFFLLPGGPFGRIALFRINQYPGQL